MPVKERRWRFRDPDPETVDNLAKCCGISPLLARILVNRGVDAPDKASFFLDASLKAMHDPLLMLGMETAVDRLAAAVAGGEHICIYGDYDVDGITSTALLVGFFRTVGADASYYIPRRIEEGYGLSVGGIEAIAARGARVIVTVDCGITAVAEAEHCRTLGIDLIITDHHMPGESLPQAFAILNPLQSGCRFPFKALAGVGIAFNLMVSLRSKLRREGRFTRCPEPDLRQYLDLVALGTIADVVPLQDENRIFVKYGLRELATGSRVGVRALKQVSGVTGPVGCGAVGFRLAPRINAAGRLEDAAPGVELLLTDNRNEAQAIAEELDAGNAERQALEQEILHDALEMVHNSPCLTGKKSIVLASEAWHPGVIGIVASRLVDLFHRPVVLIALKEGIGRGSGRSIPAFHLHDALLACAEHLVRFGGHRHAAGLSIEASTLEAFVDSFDEVADGRINPDDLLPEIFIDAELDPSDITLAQAELVDLLAPFGMGNPEPSFLLCGAQVVHSRRLKEKHLKLGLAAGGLRFEAIGFNMAEKEPSTKSVDLVFTLQVNEWNGRKSLQLKLKDLRESG